MKKFLLILSLICQFYAFATNTSNSKTLSTQAGQKQEEVEIYTVQPENFTPQAEIVAVYVEVGNKVLLLKKN